ncbi:PDZ domain containing protein, putative [Angomonas deanei]|uniref:PDZ domain containing protein, putative n=1 Tax=Angomonas deanei TaxID=59799 RepID=A0A7G2CCE3_9TRYP|nr:PDZ domain containing protein, putative [Angomonas deanei]
MERLVQTGLHTTCWFGSQDGSIEIRSASDPTYLINVIPRSDTRTIVTTIIQIGGNKVAVGLSDGTLRAFDAITMEQCRSVRAHTAAITCMSIVMMPTANSLDDDALAYPTASVLLTGSLDWTVAKWDGVSLDCLGRLHGNRRGISSITANIGGCFAFSGSEDGTIRMWSLAENSQVEVSREQKLSVLQKKCKRATSGTRNVQKKPLPTVERCGSDLLLAGPGTNVSPNRERGNSKDSDERHGGAPRKSITPAVLGKLRDAYSLFSNNCPNSPLHRSLSLRYPESAADVKFFSWPLETAHKESVTGLLIIEDVLLVSVSRDASAKVYSLPSGRHVYTLQNKSKVPLSSCMLDTPNSLILVASTDGTISGYSFVEKDFPLRFQVQSSPVSFSSSIYKLQAVAMRRLFLFSRHSPSSSTGVVGLSVMDRSTDAHGPNKTISTYKVGEPSLRELGLALSLYHKQSELKSLGDIQQKISAMGSLDAIAFIEAENTERIMKSLHAQQHSASTFEGWRTLICRSKKERRNRSVTSVFVDYRGTTSLWSCFFKWLLFAMSQRKKQHHSRLSAVQRAAHNHVSLGDSVRKENKENVSYLLPHLECLNASIVLSKYFFTWHALVKKQRKGRRQEDSFARLGTLLEGSSPPSCVSHPSDDRGAPYRIVAERGIHSMATSLTLVGNYFRDWKDWTMRNVEKTHLSADDELIETIKTHKVRRTYFSKWMNCFLMCSKNRRLSEEHNTLSREWATVEGGTASVESNDVLCERRKLLEAKREENGEKLKAAELKSAELGKELRRLYSEKPVRNVLGRFSVPTDVDPYPSGASDELWNLTCASLRSLRAAVQYNCDPSVVLAAYDYVSKLSVRRPKTSGTGLSDSVKSLSSGSPRESVGSKRKISLCEGFGSTLKELMEVLQGVLKANGKSIEDLTSECLPQTEGEPFPDGASSAHDDAECMPNLQPPTPTPSSHRQKCAAAGELGLTTKTRNTVIGLTLKLVCIFDSFIAHSEMPIEAGGRLSTRGTMAVRLIPQDLLCSHSASSDLVKIAPAILCLLRTPIVTQYTETAKLSFEDTSLPLFLSTDEPVLTEVATPSNVPKVVAPLNLGQITKESATGNSSSPMASRRRGSNLNRRQPMASLTRTNSDCGSDLNTSVASSRALFSLTPRSAIGTPRSGATTKPFLGFKVSVSQKDGKTQILVREVAENFVNCTGQEERGPAAAAGLCEGDQLVRFAGYTVTDLAAFNAIVSRHIKPHATIPVTVLRKGGSKNLSLSVGERST